MPAAADKGSAEFNLIAAERTMALASHHVVVVAPVVSAALISSCWCQRPHESARGQLATDLSDGSAGQLGVSTLHRGDLLIR